MMKYPVEVISASFAGGIAAGELFSAPFYMVYFCAATAVIFFFLSGKFDYLRPFVLVLMSAGIFLSGTLYYQPELEFSFNNELNKEEIIFYGEVSDINISGGNELRFSAAADSILFRQGTFRYPGNFICIIDSVGGKQILPGNKFRLEGRFYRGKIITNPGEMNFRKMILKNGIQGYVAAYRPENIIIINMKTNSLKSCIYKIKKSIAERITKLFNSDSAALVKGILLADRRDIDQEVRTSFINTGTAHLLAVSGLHTGYVILILMFLTGRTNIYFRGVIILAGLFFFILLTGAPASVIRASIMAGTVIISFMLNRSTGIINSISISALIILIINPSELFLPGFQLSFAAVLSIAYIYPRIKTAIQNKVKGNPVIKKILLFVGVTFAAQIGTLPLVLLYFSKFSIIAAVANIIIIPLAGIVLGSSIFTIILSVFSDYLSFAASAFTDLTVYLMYFTIDKFNGLSFSFLWIFDFSTFDVLILYFLIIVFFIAVRKVSGIPAKTALLLLVSLISTFAVSLDDKKIFEEGNLYCYMIDVGQGDAIFVKFPSGKTALIDAGPVSVNFDTGERIIEPLFNYFRVKKIDYAFISHLDNDHYSGFVHLIKKGYISHLYKPVPDSARKELNFEYFLKQNKVTYSYYSANQMEIDGAKIYILDNRAAPEMTGNDQSAVMMLLYGKTKFLFMGDAGKKAERYYINKYNKLLKTDVLKVSHHGSSTATSEDFLYITQPEISLISTGEKNHFGHPSGKVINLLDQFGCRIYRTDIEGGILLQSDGSKIKKINWNNQRR